MDEVVRKEPEAVEDREEETRRLPRGAGRSGTSGRSRTSPAARSRRNRPATGTRSSSRGRPDHITGDDRPDLDEHASSPRERDETTGTTIECFGDRRTASCPLRRSQAGRPRGRRADDPVVLDAAPPASRSQPRTGTALRIARRARRASARRPGPPRPGLAHDPAKREDVTPGDVAREVLDVFVGGEQTIPPACRPARCALPHHRDAIAETERFGRSCVMNMIVFHLLLEPHQLILHSPDQGIERAERLVLSMTSGSAANPRATPTRCCMPPES